MDQGRFFDQILQTAAGILEIGRQEILGVEDPDDFAVVILENRQTGETMAAEQLQASSLPSEISMATMSTRGVMISRTGCR